MKCTKLIKENNNVFMLDENGFKLNLENDFDIQKYEKANSVDVLKIVNKYISEKNSDFTDIITNIEKLVQKYNIDYYMFGEGKQVSRENIALIYNLKNRDSCVDCILKVFYEDKCESVPSVKYMIEFSEGSSGDYFGFSFYKYLNQSNLYEIYNLLEEYFSSDSSGDKDQMVINKCISNVKNQMEYYYS
jgi:hypothetical protein